MRLVPTLVVAVAVAGVAAGMAFHRWGASVTRPSNAQSDYFGCNDAADLVNLSLRPSYGHYQEWKLRIPKIYLGYSANWTDGEQEMIRINATYPSLEARPSGTFWTTCKKDTNTNRSSLSDWSTDRLDIRITAANVVGKPLIGFTKPVDEYVEVESTIPDLKHLQHKCMSSLPKHPDPKVRIRDCGYEYWYVPKIQDSEQPIVVRCLGAEQNPSASCAVYFSYRGHRVEYGFKRNRLADWRLFNAATSELLRRFTM
jgi:hypothetical protein